MASGISRLVQSALRVNSVKSTLNVASKASFTSARKFHNAVSLKQESSVGTSAAPVRRPHIFLVGLGAVGTCTWDFLKTWPKVNEFQIVGLDVKPPATVHEGFEFKQLTLTRENLSQVFDDVMKVQPGDVVIDLLAACGTVSVMQNSLQRGARYLNTSFEVWGDEEMPLLNDLHQDILKIQKEWQSKPDCPTAVVEHGMNPGLISHFALQSLAVAAEHAGIDYVCQHDVEADPSKAEHSGANVAYKLGLQQVHVTEVDTQVSQNELYKTKDVFASTWSIPAFWSEANVPPEWYCGTQSYPTWEFDRDASGLVGHDSKRKAYQTWVSSFIPTRGVHHGFLITHGECLSLGRNLTLRLADNKLNAPEIAFVYRPASAVVEQLKQGRYPDQYPHYIFQTERDAIKGGDYLGTFLRFDTSVQNERSNGQVKRPIHWTWVGNFLDNYHPVHNATVIQVASGVLSGLEYMLKYPTDGIRFAEQVRDRRMIIEASKQWIGEIKTFIGREDVPVDIPRTLCPTDVVN